MNKIHILHIAECAGGKKLQRSLSSTFRERFNVDIRSGKLIVGVGVFFNHDCSITVRNRVVIGDGTLFG